MDPLVYNVPAGSAQGYRGRRLIVRSRDPAQIVECIPQAEVENLLYVQLLSASGEIDDLLHWGEGVPVDVVMQDPVTEFPLLYRHARLLENHPVRISVPVVAGFSKAVKLAMSLNFAVKLEIVEQPGADLIEELSAVLDLYLHRPTVSMPVEWFHTLLLGFYSGDPATLFSVQEEDPAHFRTITEEGEETISARFAGVHTEAPGQVATAAGATVADQPQEIRVARPDGPPTAECAACEFLEPCGGYFKWPRKEYSCEGVKSLFRMLRDAAAELRSDIDACPVPQGGTPR